MKSLFEKYKKVLGENNYPKISKKEPREPYSGLIAPDITAWGKSKGKAKDKRSNILNVFVIYIQILLVFI